MSRDVGAKTSVTITAAEAAQRKTEHGKLIFTKYKGHDCALLLQNDRLKAASFYHADHTARDKNCSKTPAAVGAIYIGKIKNIAKNIDACFVEIANREICFLPMKNASVPYLVNRDYWKAMNCWYRWRERHRRPSRLPRRRISLLRTIISSFPWERRR